MPQAVQWIQSLDDPRVAPYRALKERELAREGGRFIAEGEMLVRRLLASAVPAESVLLSHKRVEELAPLVGGETRIFAAPAELVNSILGFKFHSGVMACGIRPAARALDDAAAGLSAGAMVMALPEIANTENLGALMRIAAAFGVELLVLGPRSCDPFFRQAVRVSMGTVFDLPIRRSADFAEDLLRLRDAHHVELLATVLAADAQPLAQAQRAGRAALLFGNEAQGLLAADIALCDRKITIPMREGVDSLNVAISAAVMLHHFTQGQGRAAAPV